MEHVKCANIISDLLFAYVNKDEDLPHFFEIEAVEQAVSFLREYYKGEKFTLAWFEDILTELKERYLY